jgi:hypothetical protein
LLPFIPYFITKTNYLLTKNEGDHLCLSNVLLFLSFNFKKFLRQQIPWQQIPFLIMEEKAYVFLQVFDYPVISLMSQCFSNCFPYLIYNVVTYL